MAETRAAESPAKKMKMNKSPFFGEREKENITKFALSSYPVTGFVNVLNAPSVLNTPASSERASAHEGGGGKVDN